MKELGVDDIGDLSKWSTSRARSLDRWDTEVEWPVYPAYFIRQDDDQVEVIQADPRGSPQSYHPMARDRLPFELAKIGFGDRDAALNFVRMWGLLGYDRLRQDSEEPRIGDPLEFIWWHARSVREVLEIYEALRGGDLDQLHNVLSTIVQPIPTDEKGGLRGCQHIIGSKIVTYVTGASGSQEFTALEAISDFISGNISEIHPAVHLNNLEFMFDESSPPLGSLAMTYSFETLAEAVWWHLATIVTGQRDIARCRECGHRFNLTDKRQQFCPPPEEHVLQAQRGNRYRAQSLCASKNRTRRYRSRAHSGH